ncbi:DDB1- and CUL4-associated factor 11 isoform X2 [Condylostylus longicornis]|uniref:DDB1- and CUL4-associated factor 11 isoform X2 n=1 Tax=Condylostylus longicornis TaxID=2530218 RepID=UPI00244DB3B0|nr:DDB1- and CUL4-associated factor 11 isoform X2 [Condylostylus longicornis]
MGNHPSSVMEDDDLFGYAPSDISDSDDNFRTDESFIHYLRRYVSFHGIITSNPVPSYSSTNKKMPFIRKRPDLSTFKDTELYREIKRNCDMVADNSLPDDRWSLEKLIRERENGLGRKPAGQLHTNTYRQISNLYIPNHKSQRLMSLNRQVYVAKFNKIGSRLVIASQDHFIRVFDSSKGTYHRINKIQAQEVHWCIVDLDFSPCGEYFVYSTWSDYVFTVPLHDRGNDEFHWHHMNPEGIRTCIFSVRFSPCGNFLVGGSNEASIHMYDRTVGRRVAKLTTDTNGYNDTNAISFLGDDPNIFVSGCESGVIKLWDKRCFTSGKPDLSVGLFVGHLDGITYIDPANDNRHFLTNSKDQSIKLWDIRRTSPREKESVVKVINSWDYRFDRVPAEFYNPTENLDGDSSIMTYRGHRVAKTLIRAKFSPKETTGQRYIYSGCGTGRIIIYDVLTGCIKQTVDGHKDLVRDLDWHPVRNEIISSSWDSHVNLVVFRRNELKRRQSMSSEDPSKLRRSRRLAQKRAYENYE